MRILTISLAIILSQLATAQKADQDYKYYQTYKQVIDSTYYFSYNSTSELFDLNNKDCYDYDTLATLSSRITYNFNSISEQFSVVDKMVNTISENEITQTEYSYYNNDLSEWVAEYKIKNENNTDSSFAYYANLLDYHPSYTSEYEYNVNDSVTLITEMIFDTATLAWNNFSKSSFEYIVKNVFETRYLWDTALNIWYEDIKLQTYYSENIDSLVLSVYDTVTDTWSYQQRFIYEYGNGQRKQEFLDFYNEANGWVYFSKDSVVYNTDNELVELCYMEWDAGTNNYIFISRNVYEKNYLGMDKSITYQTWNAEEWINRSKEVNYFSSIVCTLQGELAITQLISCNNANDGIIELSYTGGTEPIQMLWMNSDITEMIIENALPNTYYKVLLTDKNQCEYIDSVMLPEPDSLEIEFADIENINCFGLNDGFIRVNITGGTGSYEYSWNDELESNLDSVFNISANKYYTVNVVDDNGCEIKDSIMLSEPEELTAQVVDSKNISCFGENDGMAAITGVLGTPPYSYSWLGINTIDSVVLGLLANEYIYYSVIDNNECVYSDSIILTQPEKVVTSDITGEINVLADNAFEYSVTQKPGSSYTWEVEKGIVKYGQGTNIVLIEWSDLGNGEVSVIEEDSIACIGDTVRLAVTIETTGIDNLSHEKKYTIYPNPFNDLLKVELQQGLIIEKYQLIDLNGKIVRESTGSLSTDFVIEGSGLKKGIYYLRLISDKIFIEKVILE